MAENGVKREVSLLLKQKSKVLHSFFLCDRRRLFFFVRRLFDINIYIYIYDFAIMPDRMKLIYIESAEKTYLIASAFPLLKFSRRV